MREFLKNNKWKLLISSLIVLAPIAVGLILWDTLPETMNIHWGIDGTANGTGGRGFAVFGLPLILLPFHWLCVILTSLDKGNRGNNSKVLALSIYIMPFISVITNFIVYAVVLGWKLDMFAVLIALFGVMFVVIGNYMPKCKRNLTIGIKLPWTLASDENWNKTHRLAGKVQVIGGILCILGVVIPGASRIAFFFVILAAVIIIPTVYSYAFYRKQLKNGTFDKNAFADVIKKNKKMTVFSIVITVAVLVFAGVLMFTGEIAVEYGDTSFTVTATYYDDITVEYAKISSVELYYEDDAGTRTFGFGSAKLRFGAYDSELFGKHTRYSYVRSDMCVAVKLESGTLVLSGKTDDDTRAIYNELWSKMNG